MANPNPISHLPLNKDGSLRKTMGRPKGVGNHIGTTVREALLQTFNNLGGTKWLEKLAKDEPKAFAALLGKLIPAAIQSVDADGNDSPLEIKISYQKPDKE